MKAAINAVLRLGFEARATRSEPKRFSALVFDLGKTAPGIDLDRISETIEKIEGPGGR